MNLLLRSCIFNQRKLLAREVVSFKHKFTYSTKDNIKKQISLQEEHLSMKSNEAVGEELIYTGSLTQKVRNLKLACLATSTLTTLAQPIIFMKVFADDNLLSVGVVFAIINLFSIGTPFMVHLMARRYVIKMYKCPNETYIAKVYSFFCKQKQISFTLKDVAESSSGMITTCIVKKKPLLFDKKDFVDPKHFFTIMRLDKSLGKIIKCNS